MSEQIKLHTFAEAVQQISDGGTVCRFGSRERYSWKYNQLHRDSHAWSRQSKPDYSTGWWSVATFDLIEQASADWIFISPEQIARETAEKKEEDERQKREYEEQQSRCIKEISECAIVIKKPWGWFKRLQIRFCG